MLFTTSLIACYHVMVCNGASLKRVKKCTLRIEYLESCVAIKSLYALSTLICKFWYNSYIFLPIFMPIFIQEVICYFKGGSMSTQVFHLGDLLSGHSVKGPAIIVDNNRFGV